jgi:hypothetical protein
MSDESSRPARASWLTPSLADILFISQLIWLLLFTIHSDGSAGLLVDSNTGYHIRTGDYILEHGSIPHGDIFSFSKPGQPWYAWEWLSAASFAIVYRSQGMKGLVILSAVVIASANIILLRHMVWRGANFLVAVVAMHLVIAASSIHYLARPHVFTFLFLIISLWLIDADRLRPSKWIWALVPLTALWANMHGGFLALVASLAILAAGSVVEGLLTLERRAVSLSQARRYALLAAACVLASGLNPYGFAVHAHALPYLNTKWIRTLVQEFQSPNFQSPEGMYFEALLFSGVALATWLLSRKEVGLALLIVAWAHAALTSMRHIPIYAFVTAPLLAREATGLWNRWAHGAKRGSARAILGALASDHTAGLRRVSIWAPAAVVLLAILPLGWKWPVDFPEGRYPAVLVHKNAGLISTSRIFTTDSWADYLTFHFYPRQKIFVDGRSDFFGQEISENYVQILKGQYGWDTLMKRYDLNAALVPQQSALASLLRENPGWRLIDADSEAILFQRVN